MQKPSRNYIWLWVKSDFSYLFLGVVLITMLLSNKKKPFGTFTGAPGNPSLELPKGLEETTATSVLSNEEQKAASEQIFNSNEAAFAGCGERVCACVFFWGEWDGLWVRIWFWFGLG